MDFMQCADMMNNVTARVLEDAAFIFTEPADEPIEWNQSIVEAQLDFIGPAKGSLLLAGSFDLSTELAANLLGTEPDDPDASAKSASAAGELLNMIAGALMVELFGSEVECQLGIPQVRTMSPEQYEGDRCEANCYISLTTENEQRIDLSLIMHSG